MNNNKNNKINNNMNTNMNNRVIIAYTDGSWTSNNPNVAGFGIVITDINRNVVYTETGELTGNIVKMRQVAGEMKAAMKAVYYAINNRYNEIVIRYDYEGVEKWATGAWKAKNEWTKKYAEWMNNAMKRIRIRFEKINAADNIADMIARESTGAKDAHNSESRLKGMFNMTMKKDNNMNNNKNNDTEKVSPMIRAVATEVNKMLNNDNRIKKINNEYCTIDLIVVAKRENSDIVSVAAEARQGVISIENAEIYYKNMIKFKGFIPTEAEIKAIIGDREFIYVTSSGQGQTDPIIMIVANDRIREDRELLKLVTNNKKKLQRIKLLIRSRKFMFGNIGITDVKFLEDPADNDYRTDGVIYLNTDFVRDFNKKNGIDLVGAEVKGLVKGTIMMRADIPYNAIGVPVENALKFDTRDKNLILTRSGIAEFADFRMTHTRGLPIELIHLVNKKLTKDEKITTADLKIKIHDSKLLHYVWKIPELRTKMIVEKIMDEFKAAIVKAFKTDIRKAGAVIEPKLDLDYDEVVVPRKIAEWMNIKVGDKVALFRSPIPTLFNLAQLKVVATTEHNVIMLNPDVVKFILLGDYDGDTAFIITEPRIVKVATPPSTIIDEAKRLVTEYAEKVEERAANVGDLDEYEIWNLSYKNAQQIGRATYNHWSYIEKHYTFREQMKSWLYRVQMIIDATKYGINIGEVQSDLENEIYENMLVSGKFSAESTIELVNKKINRTEIFGIQMTEAFKLAFKKMIEYMNKDVDTADMNRIRKFTNDAIELIKKQGKTKILDEYLLTLYRDKKFNTIKTMIETDTENKIDRFILAIAALRVWNYPWNVGIAEFVNPDLIEKLYNIEHANFEDEEPEIGIDIDQEEI